MGQTAQKAPRTEEGWGDTGCRTEHWRKRVTNSPRATLYPREEAALYPLSQEPRYTWINELNTRAEEHTAQGQSTYQPILQEAGGSIPSTITETNKPSKDVNRKSKPTWERYS